MAVDHSTLNKQEAKNYSSAVWGFKHILPQKIRNDSYYFDGSYKYKVQKYVHNKKC